MNKLLIILCSLLVIFGAVENIQAKTENVNLLINGNFDAGPGMPWLEYSNHGFNIIYSYLDSLVTPHSGDYLAWLGGDNDINDYLYQDIVIPNTATNLSINLYRFFTTQETSSEIYDQVVLSLRNPTTNQVLETLATWSNLDSTSGWIQQSLPITGNYAGIPVRVYLSSITDSSLITNFFFDTISLNATIKVGSIPGAVFLLLE